MNEQTVFLKALEIDSPQQRGEFLDQACAGDAALREGVESLLRSHRTAADFLKKTYLLSEVSGDEPPDDEVSLDFLAPSEREDALGRLGCYEVLEVLGHGGMGVVLKAFDTKLSRIVAVKALASQIAANAMARRRFLREARAAAAVSHPHVVTIYAVDEANETPYLVMECVEGKTLQKKIEDQGALGLKEILRIGSQVAQGLAAAHAQGLIHRDVKPGNILLENGVERVKLTDFGLARAVDDLGVTRTGEITGTPEFMSPEQAQGEKVDYRSDLFSLGSVLYVMCTGRSAFRATSTIAAIRRVCDNAPRPISEVNPEIPPWLAEIVDRLLAKTPDDRLQTASEVAGLLSRRLAALQSLQNDPSAASAVASRAGRPGRPAFASRLGAARAMMRRDWRSKWWLAGAGVLVLFIVLCLTEATGVTSFLGGASRSADGEAPSYGHPMDVPALRADRAEGIEVVTGRGPLGDPNVDVLRVNDAMQVTVRSPKKSYLYLVLLESDGSVRPLYPWIDADWRRRTKEEKREESTVSVPSLLDRGKPMGGCILLLLARDERLEDKKDFSSLFAHFPTSAATQGLAGAWYVDGTLREMSGFRQPRRPVTTEDLEPQFDQLRIVEEEIRKLSPRFSWTAGLLFSIAPARATRHHRPGMPGDGGPEGFRPPRREAGPAGPMPRDRPGAYGDDEPGRYRRPPREGGRPGPAGRNMRGMPGSSEPGDGWSGPPSDPNGREPFGPERRRAE